MEPRKLGQVTLADGEVVEMFEGRYVTAPEKIAIIAVALDGFPYGTLSVNVPDDVVPERCFRVKDWSENGPLAEAAARSPLFRVRHDVPGAPTGHVVAAAWELVR